MGKTIKSERVWMDRRESREQRRFARRVGKQLTTEQVMDLSDPRAAILAKARMYYAGSEPRPFTHTGIEFYNVGHNASHSFALGVDSSGQVWVHAFGEDSWDSETNAPVYGESVACVGNIESVGYIGHF